MGAYLSRPIFEPESSSGSGRGLEFGASSVQGWRTSQEDAHNCIIDFDDDCSFFAVYDGHGGSEVSKYCSLHLPAFVKTLSSYKAGDFKQALIDAFLKFDQTLTKLETIEVLKQLAQFESGDEGDEDEVREETDKLREEAKMPLEEILMIYKTARDNMKAKKKESNGTEDIKDAEESKDENEAEGGHEGSSEAVAKVDDEKAQGDHGSKSGDKSEKPDEKTNGIPGKEAKKSKGEEPKPCSAGSSSEEVASSAGSQHDDVAKSSEGRGGRAAAQRARRIITDEENNNNNRNNNNINNNNADDDDDDDDDDDESESSSEIDSEDQINDDEESTEDDEDDEDDEDEDDDEESQNDDVEVFDSDVPGSGSGSTAVVALLKGNLLTVANAGDSRAVICRNGKAIDMSIDHKPEDAVERMRIERAGGKITADGRVNRGLNLSRAIGDHVYKQNAKLPLAQQMISPLPDVQSIVVDRQTDDFLVLACDGIWNCMTSQEVCDFVAACLMQGDKLTDVCEQLFRRCIAPDTSGDGTGCDNMTCIIVRLAETAGNKRASDESSEQAVKKSRKNDDDDGDRDRNRNDAAGNASGEDNDDDGSHVKEPPAAKAVDTSGAQ